MQTDIDQYHAKLTPSSLLICDTLRAVINEQLVTAQSKVWHGHPVWFINNNPIVGYDQLKDCVRLLFWSGQSFDEPGLAPSGSFQAAEAKYTNVDQINIHDLTRWLGKSITIQWDYANIVKRKGKLVRISE